MKGVIEEGLNVFEGHRFRVTMGGCSLDQLRRMLAKIDAEAERVKRNLAEIEAGIRRCYEGDEEADLEYKAGAYRFPLDRHKELLADERERLADLADKRRAVYSAFQEKHLLERQSRILGGRRGVRVKDSIVFLLIVAVLALLGIDAGNVGAGGSGAELKPVVENGSLAAVEIVNPGREYARAYAIAIDGGESPVRGAEIFLEVANGGVAKAAVLASGTGYDESLRIEVRPLFSNDTLHLFWLVDFSCCLVFLANFLFEMLLSNSRRWYWRTHWIDFVTSLPLPPTQIFAQLGFSGGELLRAGRLLRLLRLLRVLRVLRLFLFMWRGLDQLAEIFDVRLMKKSLFIGLLVLTVGAVLVSLSGESGDGHEAVSGFLPSLWWSFTTLVTGGFADIYNPHTLGGRLLTVFLVIAGMVLVGVFTATLTTILVGREERVQSAVQNEMLQLMKEAGGRTDAVIRQIEARQRGFADRFGNLEEQIRRIEAGPRNDPGCDPETT